ncbi:MAG: triose-phosphate isomerase [Gammaproteobacteria bacterium]|nr:triose-phosphate isomerase [Gammaproteobacteria bacterium]
MRRAVVAANWKMHGSRTMVREYLSGLRGHALEHDRVQLVLCPPMVYLPALGGGLEPSLQAGLGAQDCSSESDDGAYTGEVSARMLADMGCKYVIVGHSERRERCYEDDARVAAKFLAAQSAGLTPILCVGETAEERDAGRAEQAVSRQFEAVIERAGAAGFHAALLAYEPVWAIGTGRSATPEIAQSMHALLRAALARRDAQTASKLRILYGGSVKTGNAASLFSQAEIDGALVGGASLVPEDLLAIAAAAAAGTD